MTRFTCSLLVGLLLALPATAAAPNVILVMTDDQGYPDLGCHGNTMIRTPNLDKLHGQSVRLTNFHVDPTCSPTRSALMTGRYSTRTGAWHTIMGRSLMYHDEVTMADVFTANGYRTGIFGKWHLGDNYPMRPQDRGFQETLVLGGGGITQAPDYWGNTYFDDTFMHNGKPEKFKGYCTDVFFANALAFIEKNKGKPFFAYITPNAPHSPYNVADKYSKPYRDKGVSEQMANFYGMIENIDENMGRLLAKLKDWGLEDNTILIFMTDNGSAAGTVRKVKEEWKGYSAGMRAQKGSEYDGGHRVPCFIRWPNGKVGGGKDAAKLTAHIDLLPTLLDLCSMKMPKEVKFDGKSLVPLLKGEAKDWPERTLFVHSQRIEYPEKWKQSAVMTERWRLVNGKELYDIQADPGQEKNIADAKAKVVKQLRQAYDGWWDSLKPRFDTYGYIVVGSDKENPSLICGHDWHAPAGEVPVTQEVVKKAPWINGYWMIDVAQAGKYEITLRQQPAVAKFPVEASQAKVKVGDVEQSGLIAKGADGVTLTLDLKTGKQKLQTWLTDEKAGKSRGAFYVEVRRVVK